MDTETKDLVQVTRQFVKNHIKNSRTLLQLLTQLDEKLDEHHE